jgi:hypothetical protein
MPTHAGYVAAIAIRDRALDAALLSAYRGNRIRHLITKSFGQLPPPRGSVNLFFQSPQVILSDVNPVDAILRFSGWGTIGLLNVAAPPPAHLSALQQPHHAPVRCTKPTRTRATQFLVECATPAATGTPEPPR